jgi:hypothetical protein
MQSDSPSPETRPPHQLHHLIGMLRPVVHAAQQHILKRHRSRGRSGTCRTASITASMLHFRVTGMISLAHCIVRRIQAEIASFGRTFAGSCANRKMPGTIPEVETVIRDSGILHRPSSSAPPP